MMGINISRQRYYETNELAVELCIGKKHVGVDVLPVKWDTPGLCEGRYLVSPVDAVNCAVRIYEAWHLQNHYEPKKISLVNAEGKAERYMFDPQDKHQMDRLKKWAEASLKAMDKCGSCGKPIGASNAVCETEELPNKIFCQETCAANLYRHLYGKEMPRIDPAKRNAKKKP